MITNSPIARKLCGVRKVAASMTLQGGGGGGGGWLQFTTFKKDCLLLF